MKNPRCSELSLELEHELINSFPQWLDDGEEEKAGQFFRQYLFYRREDASTRWCVCTECGEFMADRQINAELFRHKHGDYTTCPRCGAAVKLAAIGRYRNFNSMQREEKLIQLTRKGEWLLIQAGRIRQSFYWDYELIQYDLDFQPYIRYAFAPGKQCMWKRNWRDKTWMMQKSVMEPFPPVACVLGEPFQPYWALGLEELGMSSMRYCQYEAWFDSVYGASLNASLYDGDKIKIHYLIRYLSEYIRRPQLEFLVKLGHMDVVRHLILDRDTSANAVNWRAKEPAAFFRLSKQDYRTFRGSGLSLQDLTVGRDLIGKGLVRDLSEFFGLLNVCGTDLQDILRTSQRAGVRPSRAVSYLTGQGDRLGSNRAVMLWRDYIDAAVKLSYDLSREDVSMPKDLVARHDDATAAVQSEADKKLEKGYRRRKKKLLAQYEFRADGLRIIVPEGIREIVREGKELRHCVGGYAARHCQGKVTILFLRKEEAPEAPYVTVELTVGANPARISIKQAHGYRNDFGSEPPLVTHREFFDRWLDWIHAGSPRDAEGRPVERQQEKVKAEVTVA